MTTQEQYQDREARLIKVSEHLFAIQNLIVPNSDSAALVGVSGISRALNLIVAPEIARAKLGADELA